MYRLRKRIVHTLGLPSLSGDVATRKTPFYDDVENGSFPPTVPSVSVQKLANIVRRPLEVYTRQGLRPKLACASFLKVIRGPAIFN